MPHTGVAIVDWILSALNAWGYPIVFVATILENLFVIGSFTPGETIVIAAALVASRGSLSLTLVWVMSVLGTLVGSNISYWGGRKAGRHRVLAFSERLAENPVGRLFRIDEDTMADAEFYFHTHGAKTVFVSRFAVGFKNFVPVIAGVTKMPVFWFELYTVIGAVVYTSAMCAIGWFLGTNFDKALKVASGIGWVGFTLVALVLVALWIGRRRWREHRIHMQEQAAAERAALEAELVVALESTGDEQDAEREHDHS